MDLKPHFRVFQNKNTLCKTIHEKITNAYPEGRVFATEGDNDKTLGVLIQYHETDWEYPPHAAIPCHCAFSPYIHAYPALCGYLW